MLVLTASLAVVGGLGISIPLGNVNQPMQAAINIHLWGSYTVGNLYIYKDPRTGVPFDAMGTGKKVSNWAFVFGPSITVGSIGALF